MEYNFLTETTAKRNFLGQYQYQHPTTIHYAINIDILNYGKFCAYKWAHLIERGVICLAWLKWFHKTRAKTKTIIIVISYWMWTL